MSTTDKYYNHVFDTLSKISVSESAVVLLEKFKEKRLLEEMSVLAYEASEGMRTVTDVMAIAEQLKNPQAIANFEYVEDDLEAILNNTVKEPGLRWRLQFLNRSLGSLRPGDFGFIFARPETGKTTFLASEITYMAEQANHRAMGPVVWLNNEEQGRKVKLRMYQGALGANLNHLLTDPKASQTAYLNKVGDKLRLLDSATIHRSQVEALCEKEKPSLIVFDQIDKVKGFKADREDLVMGAIYVWSREIAKHYCPVIGVCQADGTAENERWLYMTHVANAKTAKQAEADFILGIGKSNDPGFEFIRFLNISKNKLAGDPDTEAALRHGRTEIKIRPDVARYEDL
jgi:replicative DNA helicase